MKKIFPSILVATLLATSSCSVFQQPIKKIMGDKAQPEAVKTEKPAEDTQTQKRNNCGKEKETQTHHRSD